MEILLKFTWKNIKEKKLRTALIIFSIILSTALFFGSLGVAKTIEKSYTEFLTKYYGSAELMVYPNQHSPRSFVSDGLLARYSKDLEYVVGSIGTTGIYKPQVDQAVRFSVLGFNYPQVQAMHSLYLEEAMDLEPFNGPKTIISKETAKKYNLSLGELLYLEIDGEKIPFRIVAIAQPAGIFLEDGRSTYAMVPKEYLGALNQVRNSSSTLYLKLAKGIDRESFIKRVAEENPRVTIRDTIEIEAIKAFSNQLTQPFTMMVLVVIIISIFIIYNSFKVIAYERIPVIGTFRSVGATKRMVNLVFLGESLLYGVLGGALGGGLGIGVLYIMAKLMTPTWMGGATTQMVFSPLLLFTSFVLAVLLSVLSAWLPIKRVANLALKDIILNNIDTRKGAAKYKYFLGAALILFSLVASAQARGEWAMVVYGLSIVANLSGIILLVPLAIKYLIKGLEGIYSLIFGNEGVLALKNLRDNGNLRNNIILLNIGITSIILIKVVGFSVMTEVTSFFRDWRFEIMASPPRAERTVENSFRSIQGITDVYGVLSANNVEMAGTTTKIGMLEGINSRIFDFMDLKTDMDQGELMDLLNSGRNIVFSNLLKDRLRLQVGDVVQLKAPRGEIPYQVVGFLDTIENNGQYAIIADKYLRVDMERRYFTYLYIKTNGDPKDVQARINAKYSREPFWNQTVQEIEEINDDINKRLFLIMDGFSYMTILIGTFGVFNNYVINILERRRSLAILRSIGMSRRQLRKILTIEALTGGVIAGIIGLLGAFSAIAIAKYLLMNMGLRGQMLYEPLTILLILVAGVLVSIIASISPVQKASQESIISALR